MQIPRGRARQVAEQVQRPRGGRLGLGRMPQEFRPEHEEGWSCQLLGQGAQREGQASRGGQELWFVPTECEMPVNTAWRCQAGSGIHESGVQGQGPAGDKNL